MMDTSKLTILDHDIKESNIKDTKKVNTKKNNKHTSTKTHVNNNVRLSRKFQKRLAKKLKKSEGKNYNNSMSIIEQRRLHFNKIVNVRSLPNVCRNCKSCVKLFGYCNSYVKEIEKLTAFNFLNDNKCTFQKPIT